MITTEEALAIWREGISPQLGTPLLEALADGLIRDDARLLQGITASQGYEPDGSRPVLGACAVCYAAWQGADCFTLERLEGFLESICSTSLTLLGDRSADTFLQWWDQSPRSEVVPALLADVEAELTRREVEAHEAEPVEVEVGCGFRD